MPGATFNLPDAYAAFGVRAADGIMNAVGPNTRLLTSATAAFKQTDVGKRITVAGAGAAGADLKTTIVRLVSATKVELKLPALTTVAAANISYVKGVYRLSDLIALGDVDGNVYSFLYARRIQIQVKAAGTKIFIGGPYVTPTNAGIELPADQVSDFVPGGSLAVTSNDYLTSTTANQKVNIFWTDDLNLSTPAP